MCITYTCRLDETSAYFVDTATDVCNILSRRDFERMISRRQLNKISNATQIAAAMFRHFSINDKLLEMGSDPSETPLVICNRYANWDYVADVLSSSIAETMHSVNGYVATAWFPATIQGFLTIENGNVGEAITIASQDESLICATIGSLMPTNRQRAGAIVLGTFECVPNKIGGRSVTGQRPTAFGALSLISAKENTTTITATVATHQEMYNNATT